MHSSPQSSTTSLMAPIDTQSRYSKKSPQRSLLSSLLILIEFLLKFETCSLQAVNELLAETCRRVDTTRKFMFILKNRYCCFCQQYSGYCSKFSKTLNQLLGNLQPYIDPWKWARQKALGGFGACTSGFAIPR